VDHHIERSAPADIPAGVEPVVIAARYRVHRYDTVVEEAAFRASRRVEAWKE
jgi:hypothetical protein